MPKGSREAHRVAVKDYQFTDNMTVDELVGQMETAWGFTAGKLATGVNIMEAMIARSQLEPYTVIHYLRNQWHPQLAVLAFAGGFSG